jgi:threonine dehydratase
MQIPALDAIRALHTRLAPLVRQTPIWPWSSRALDAALGATPAPAPAAPAPAATVPPAAPAPAAPVVLKLELFQHTGSFKIRGALANMLDLDRPALACGVTAVSAGNHAIAVAFAASLLGTTAKVVMPRTASPFRIARCQAYGAEVVLADDVRDAFARVQAIERAEGRTFVHPYEGLQTALGTATLGLEFLTQAPGLDAVIIPIGGGGLCGGMAAAIKQLKPTCAVYGVEPTGADTMARSFAAGSPQAIDRVRTIADSLGAPYALPYSYALCREFVDDLVLIDDDAMRRAMGLLYADMKLAVEPAGAAATAALCGPLRERLAGQQVGVIVCGSNIDLPTFAQQALVA